MKNYGDLGGFYPPRPTASFSIVFISESASFINCSLLSLLLLLYYYYYIIIIIIIIIIIHLKVVLNLLLRQSFYKYVPQKYDCLYIEATYHSQYTSFQCSKLRWFPFQQCVIPYFTCYCYVDFSHLTATTCARKKEDDDDEEEAQKMRIWNCTKTH